MVTNHDATMLPTKMANSLDGVGESVQVSDWVDAALPTWQHRPISPPSLPLLPLTAHIHWPGPRILFVAVRSDFV